MAPPTSAKIQMKSMLKPCPAVSALRDVDVVGRVGVGRVRELPDQHRPDGEGEPVQEQGGTHGRCSVAPGHAPADSTNGTPAACLVGRIDFAGCQTQPAWRSSFPPSMRRLDWGPPWTSCSATSDVGEPTLARAPPARPTFRPGSTSWSSTTAAPTGRPPSCWRGPRPAGGVPPVRPCASCPCPHGGKGAAVRAGMLAADGRPHRLRGRRHGDAARPAPVADRCARRPRRRARVADPARRVGHANEPAVLPTDAGRGCSMSWRRSGSSVRSRTPSAGSRGSVATRRTISSSAQEIRSIVFDVELIYLARRRGYRIAIVPIRWSDRRGSRMRPRAGTRHDRRLGSHPDPPVASGRQADRHVT